MDVGTLEDRLHKPLTPQCLPELTRRLICSVCLLKEIAVRGEHNLIE